MNSKPRDRIRLKYLRRGRTVILNYINEIPCTGIFRGIENNDTILFQELNSNIVQRFSYFMLDTYIKHPIEKHGILVRTLKVLLKVILFVPLSVIYPFEGIYFILRFLFLGCKTPEKLLLDRILIW